MSLFADMMEPCVKMVRESTPDGEGGRTVTWAEGDPFDAAIHRETTLNARIAEKQGMTDVYTVTVLPGVQLGFHDVLKRVSDGKTFRTTASTEDRHTPNMATFQFSRVQAEEWPLSGPETDSEAQQPQTEGGDGE